MGAAAALLVLVAACTNGDVKSPDTMNPYPDARTDAGNALAPVAAATVPDTTAEAVWQYLQEQGYDEWALWPGTEPFYEGGRPHGALLTTYVNPDAADGLGDLMARRGMSDPQVAPGGNSLPYGSIVVKENHGPDSTLAAVTVMYKVPGYDPEHRDWWWMKRLADGTVEAAGRVESCIDCHQENADLDYLMTAR